MTCPNCQAENAEGAEICFTCGRSFGAVTQGKLIDARYEILSLVGKGGMGMVYRAHDKMLDEPVALKVLRSEFVDTPAMAERFRSEIKLARKVSHPNVCRIHGYGQDGGTSYISMELLEGVDLKQALAQHPQGLPRDEAFSASLQVAKGLAAIHEVGIIHRDLKTPNAMRDTSGVVKLMDFGIARSAEGRGHTKTGEVMGTPEYMSPEQCRGEKLDFRSDVYALGIVIFELFTGEVPFRGENIMATLFKQIGEAVPFDGPVGSRLPRSVVPVLEKALAKKPLDRYQSVAELYAALRRARRQDGPAVAEEPASLDDSLPPGSSEGAGAERRTQSRLDIHVNVYLCRLDSSGQVMHQERTIADNLSRRGARVMTSVPDLSVGDSVVLKEVSGDFTTPALVRNAFVGRDNIPRLGLEFVGNVAPDRLVQTESERIQEQPEKPRTSPRPPAPAAAASDSGAPRATGTERRSHSRLAISVEIALRRLQPPNSKEERTVADNISRGGARVLTSMTDLRPGDKVALREINGDFATEAIVRNNFTGPDFIPRLGIEFVGNSAPDRLVPSDGARRQKRPATTGAQPSPKPAAATTGPQPPVPKPAAPPAPAPPTPPPASAKADSGPIPLTAAAIETARREILDLRESLAKKNHFDVLGIPRRSNEDEVKKAYLPLAKRYHPDASRDPRLGDLAKEISAIFVRVGEAYEVLADPAKRSRYEELLGPDRSRPMIASIFKPGSTGTTPASGLPTPSIPEAPPPPAPETEEQRLYRADLTVRKAKKCIAENQYWDAIQLLEPLLDEPISGRLSSSVRLVLAQALAKNPKWLKRAEELVISVVRDDPGYVDAHFALAMVHKQAGLTARARTALRKVLELAPGNETALAELEALDSAPDVKR